MNEILELFKLYELEVILIAVLINVLTGIIKTPIKLIAKKSKCSKKITRFIVFLPIVLGFLLVFIYHHYINGYVNFDSEFFKKWITSTSLSLTFYAIVEKILPSKSSIQQSIEVETSQKILESISEFLKTNTTINSDIANVEASYKKIVLKGKRD